MKHELHVLLSSEAEEEQQEEALGTGPGYKYHTVKMKALPLSKAPAVENLSKKLGTRFQTPNNDWNIGINF